MIKVFVIIFCVLMCGLVLKSYNKPIATIISVVGVVLCFVMLVSSIKNVTHSIVDIASNAPTALPYIKVLLKILCIVICTQLMAQICRDNGENALASFTEISAKLIIVTMILPFFETVISIMNGLVK